LVPACTAVRVEPVDPTMRVSHVCIEDNPSVIVAGFVQIIRDGFSRHGVSTEVFSGSPPAGCELTLTYTARQSWDFVSYLSHAELRLLKAGSQVAYAEYHLRAKGGLSPMKWKSTASKMGPVVDRLLETSSRVSAPASG